MNINVCVDSLFFNKTLEVILEWELPFLPRKGDELAPELIASSCDKEQVCSILSEKGWTSLNDWGNDFHGWLHEVLQFQETNVVDAVSFFRRREGDIGIRLYLDYDDGLQNE